MGGTIFLLVAWCYQQIVAVVVVVVVAVALVQY
jgi:hypothetical protein